MQPPSETATEPRVRIAVSRDAGSAETWAGALMDADIDARVEIDDDRNIPSEALPLAPYVGTRHVYTVSVPLNDRERAAGILERLRAAEEPGVPMDPRRVVTGIAIALSVTLAVVLLLVALG